MHKLVIAAAIATGLALPAFAAPAAYTTNPKDVQAGTYAIEPTHTRVLFSVDHMGFSTWYGEFTGATGTLTLNPTKPAASTLDVSIPVGNVSTSNTKLDGELKSPMWFDAAQFPAMTFHATNVAVAGHGTAKVTGALTFHGVTRSVTLNVKLHGAGPNPVFKTYTVGFDATGRIHRSDFGVKAYVPVVGDDVDLIISAAFVPK